MNPDTTIIGAGAIGLALAWELSRRGQRVVVLDRGPLAKGASWAAAGILPPACGEKTNDAIDLLRARSHALFPKWADELRRETGIDCQLRRCGGWYLADSPGEMAAMVGQSQYWHELGVQCKQESLSTLVNREPVLEHWAKQAETSGNTGAWFVPDEYQIRSPDYLAALIAGCEKNGVEFRSHHQVDDVSETANEVVLTGHINQPVGPKAKSISDSATSFRLASDNVAVCAGVWTGRVAVRLRLCESFIPIRGQILMLKSRRPLFQSVINLGHRYFVPRIDGVTLVGSCEEEVGFQHGTTPSILSDLRSFIERFGPDVNQACETRAWSGLRPLTFDGFPAIGRVPEYRRTFVAAGHFRSGVHLSPGTAIDLADLITGCQNASDGDAFSVGRQQQHSQTNES